MEIPGNFGLPGLFKEPYVRKKCEHNREKSKCKECGGASICEHNRRKSECKECGGSEWLKHKCKTEYCDTKGHKKYEGYCLPCVIQQRPDIQVSRNYKTKERHVADFVVSNFPEYSWILDKKNPDGCSARRPDIRCDFGTHILIIEVDEDKHGSYECSCENKRVMEISQDHGHRPIVFLRFNPDKYLTTDDVKIPSPWRLNKLGVMTLVKTREGDWNNRLVCLKDQIQYWIDNVTDKMVETVHLFY